MNKMSVTEKLAVNKFELDEGHPHITLNNEGCRQCQDKPCLFVCPAEVYKEKDGEILAEWAACLECGTCNIVCPQKCLTWTYPRGGFGINYRYA